MGVDRYKEGRVIREAPEVNEWEAFFSAFTILSLHTTSIHIFMILQLYTYTKN